MNYSIILPTLNENGHIIKLINAITKNAIAIIDKPAKTAIIR